MRSPKGSMYSGKRSGPRQTKNFLPEMYNQNQFKTVPESPNLFSRRSIRISGLIESNAALRVYPEESEKRPYWHASLLILRSLIIQDNR